MKVYDYSSRERYDNGLKRIRALIEQSLIKAGAHMEAGCISVPVWRYPRHGIDSICVVPCDAPKMKVGFTVGEIMESRVGDLSHDVLQKIGLYVSEYVRFRQSSDKLALLHDRITCTLTISK